ncbi:MAG: helicase C-terminal domain-containing protein [Candidatus Heimdallarchaeota archaeon]
MNYLEFFPYEKFRQEQENIIKKIEKTSREKKVVLLSAPNGTGKTIIALSALLPLAYEKELKIIYLCRTHAQNTRIIKELNKISKLLENSKLENKVNGLSIRGRNEMCLNKTLIQLKLNPREAMSVCSDLRKNRNCVPYNNLIRKKEQLDNLKLIVPEIINKPLDAEELIDFCKQKVFCPYFLSKFLLNEMNLVICNYQWLFNPFIRVNFLNFLGKELMNCILVIDECHNLIDVATEINSTQITPYLLRLALRDLELYNSPISLQSFVNFMLDHLEKVSKTLNNYEEEINPESFLQYLIKSLGLSSLMQLENLIRDLYDFGASIHEQRIANGEFSRNHIGNLAEFWIKWFQTYSLANFFFCYTRREKKGKKSVLLEIVALDPRDLTIPILKECFTCLNLSGTVNPHVYTNLIGFKESGKKYEGIIAESPFSKKNICALIIDGVDTRKVNRTSAMYKKMITKIDEIISCTPANIGIFCASYKVLEGLVSNGLEIIIEKNNKKLFVEDSGLSASENFALVNNYKSMAEVNNGAVLLGVCGGRNSEGEDYPGKFMNCVIIAGFPYHLPLPRVNAKIKYYDKVFNKQGWNFAYLYPAVQRANQASGRPIRKLSDKGAIIFMDSRFKAKHNWISEWIRKELEIVPDKPNALRENLSSFWNVN